MLARPKSRLPSPIPTFSTLYSAVELPFGTVSVKRCTWNGVVRNYPEYESVRALAEQAGKEFQLVFALAKQAAEELE